jgi:hypothetical protein
MNTNSKPTMEQIVALLDKWISQRPGLEYGNYGEIKSYRAECRHIANQLHDARAMLRYIDHPYYLTVTAEDMLDAFKNAFSGRLSITAGKKPGTWEIDYCTGQYFPTEYRAAACAVMASALWNWLRPDYEKAENPGDALRNAFKRMFGAGIQKRWFD